MSTQRSFSAVFPNISGPNPPRMWPWNGGPALGEMRFGPGPMGPDGRSPWPGLSGNGGPGCPPDKVRWAQPANTSMNYSDTQGLWGKSWWLRPGQIGRFIVVILDGTLPKESRGALESRLEQQGVWTKEWHHVGFGNQLVWLAGPRDAVMESGRIARQMTEAVIPLTSPGARVFAYMPAPAEWASFNALTQGDTIAGLGAAGLGDLVDQLSRGALRLSADMICSPAFQAAATQAIADRHGEAQAQLFREQLRLATQFCRPGAAERIEEAKKAKAKKQLYWVLGGLGVAAGLVVLSRVLRKSNRGKRRGSRSRKANIAPIYHVQSLGPRGHESWAESKTLAGARAKAAKVLFLTGQPSRILEATGWRTRLVEEVR